MGSPPRNGSGFGLLTPGFQSVWLIGRLIAQLVSAEGAFLLTYFERDVEIVSYYDDCFPAVDISNRVFRAEL